MSNSHPQLEITKMQHAEPLATGNILVAKSSLVVVRETMSQEELIFNFPEYLKETRDC